jgi:hypothetical protein
VRLTANPTGPHYSRKPDVPGRATECVNWDNLFEQAEKYRADPDETIDRVRARLRELRDE